MKNQFVPNVGIGTTSPGEELHVSSGAGGGSTPLADRDIITLENDNTAALNIITPTNALGQILFSDDVRARGGIRYNHGTDSMDFGTAGVYPRVIIDSSGNVGIGTTVPAERLDVGDGYVKMGYEQVFADCNNTADCAVSCPAGKRVTGGGCLRINGPAAGIMDNYGNTTYWACRWESSMIVARAYAYCVNIR